MVDDETDDEKNVNDEGEANVSDLNESIRAILTSIEKENISYINAESIINRVQNSAELIEGHVSNALYLQKRKTKEFNDMKNRKSVSKIISEEKLCPIELLSLIKDIKDFASEAFEWDRTCLSMYKLLVPKLKTAIATVKSFDIEKEVTSNFRTMQKEWFDFVKNTTEAKFAAMQAEISKIKDQRVSDVTKLNDKISELREALLSKENREEFKPAKRSFSFDKRVEEDLVEDNDSVIEDIKETPENIKTIINPKDINTDMMCDACGETFTHRSMLIAHKTKCRGDTE